MENAVLSNEVFTASAVEAIANWDLSKVKAKLSQKGYSSKELEILEVEYKRFLTLVVKYSTRLPISEPVDEMWHTHILFTRDYAKLGDAIGYFIHHEPITTEERKRTLLSAYEDTLSLYNDNWGTPDPLYWPPLACVCDPEGEGTDDTGGQW